jgi:hypothetical protein
MEKRLFQRFVEGFKDLEKSGLSLHTNQVENAVLEDTSQEYKYGATVPYESM